MHAVRKVTEDIYWVGAHDHKTSYFENIHPIEGIGVSYNSYLLLGEETALFDTVDHTCSRQFFENLEYLLAGRKLDYIVVHHFEPDHGSSLADILLRYKEAKVIASAKARDQIRRFDLELPDERFIEIGDKGSLTLAGREFRFISAPMVHWPEVMLSFDTVSGALFAADAFGSFKALDGALFADEIDFEGEWLGEFRRYYANIVGKYGAQVQALLCKLSPLLEEVKYICPLHGPVWRESLPKIINLYNKWSLYEPEEQGVLIVYGSMYGNTESAALALASKLRERGLSKVSVREVTSTHVSVLISEVFKYSHVVIASVTYNNGIFPPIKDFLADMKALGVAGRTYALIENGTWAPQSAKLIRTFIEEELKNARLLPTALSIDSHLAACREDELDGFADALIASFSL